MKNNKLIYKFGAIVFTLLFVVMLIPVNAQIKKTFTQRESQYSPGKKIYNIKGDFQMIGNTNMTLVNYTDGGDNSSDMKYVDVDGINTTLNSSSATLTFPVENTSTPACSNIIYAGLYWIGRADDGGASPLTVNIDESTENYYNTNTVNGYTLAISQSKSGTVYTAIYTFTPTTGSPVIFTFVTNGSLVSSLTVKTGIGGTSSNIPYSSSTQTNNSRITATFNTAYVISTGATSITINNLRKAYDNNTIDTDFRSSVTTSSKSLNKLQVKLKHGTDSYQTVTANANDIYYPNNTDGNMYSAFAEVTDYVKTHGLGEYTVADIALRAGSGGGTGYFGGWGMIVVYENSKMKWRDVTIFDGHAYVEGSTTVSYELPVSGFQTALNGNINMKLGIIAGEGDNSIDGDYFQIRNHTNTQWVDLKHSGNATTNFFNSSIPGTNARNPSLLNNTGVDIAMFNISNTNNTVIKNNQTSTTFRYGSTQDTYIIPCIAMAVDAYVPDAVVDNTIVSINNTPYNLLTNSTILPNEEVEYAIHIYNKGNEQINNMKLVIPIPYTASFAAGSISVVNSEWTGYTTPTPIYDAALGSNGSIVWSGGNVPQPPTTETLLGTLKFKLKATTNCFILANQNCTLKLTVDGTISGVGAISGTVFDNKKVIQGYQMNGACQGEPIYDPVSIPINGAAWVAANCNSDQGIDYSVQKFNYCYFQRESIPFVDVTGNFPPGTRYYSALEPSSNIPLTGASEYTSTTGFPNVVGTTTYFAVPPGITTCWWEFSIMIDNCNLWYGANSTDWGTAANWTASVVPNGADEDVIFATPLNYGQHAVRDLELDIDRTIGNITNNSNKRLIIPVNRTLIVDKKGITGTGVQLLIKSELDKANGTLIFNDITQNQAVEATVQFASKSKPGSGVWPREWQFFGIPVKNRTLTNLFGTNVQGSIDGGIPGNSLIVRKYNESLNLSYSAQEKWDDLIASSVMLPYFGYEVTQPIAGTIYNFEGGLVTDVEKTLTFSISAAGVYSRGNYILANPYTAPIFVNKMLASDFVNLAPTIYVYNTGSRQNWLTNNGMSQTGDLPGTYSAIPINAATTIGKNQIPSLQAFMVKAISDAAPTTSFKFRYPTVYRGTLTNPNEPMKVNRVSAETNEDATNTDIKPMITMDVIGENGSDRVYLITAAGRSKLYDAGWDGYKSLSTDNVQLYAMDADNKRMQVNTDNDLNNTYIGFRSAGESTYTLKFKLNSEMKGIYETLFVQDLATGVTKEITDGMTMNFATADGSAEKRFKLLAAKIISNINTVDNSTAIKLSANSSSIIVSNNTNSEVVVTVYNIIGQPILTSIEPIGDQTINHNLTKGTYIIEAKSINKNSKTILKSVIY